MSNDVAESAPGTPAPSEGTRRIDPDERAKESRSRFVPERPQSAIPTSSAGWPVTLVFDARPEPSAELCSVVAALVPTNHSYTYAYTQAMSRLGYRPWVLSLLEGDRMSLACTAFMTSGRLNRALEIVSLPALPAGDQFWQGLLRLCREAGVSQLVVGSFDSAVATIPDLPGEIARKTRHEFVLDLESPRLWKDLGSNHLRNIKSARKAGVQVLTAADLRACQAHAELLRASMERRRSRGETVSADIRVERPLAFTDSGAGVIYQAVLDDKILSSMLVLRGERGAYYQSAGTSPEGMACGASHFLLYEIAERLRSEAMRQFNLGGASPRNPGLQRFKQGFGAEELQLEAAEFYLGSALRRTVTGAASFLLGRLRPSSKR